MYADKLRVFVFEDDLALSSLLKTILQGCGCDVKTFADPVTCPIYRTPGCNCPEDSPCADVLISDIMMPTMTGIELFKLQRMRGCKALDENKALISATRSSETLVEASKLGCRFFSKPFKNSEMKAWIQECSERLSAKH